MVRVNMTQRLRNTIITFNKQVIMSTEKMSKTEIIFKVLITILSALLPVLGSLKKK